MSQDKKKKAVPSWTPHPMPGMLGQTGPSAEAREQLIKEGIWKGDAPNRAVAQRGPLTQRPAPGFEERPQALDAKSDHSVEGSSAMYPASKREQEEETAALDDPEGSSDRHQFTAPSGVTPTPSRPQQQFQADVVSTPSRHQEQFAADVAPTPNFSRRRADAAEVAQRRQSDATGSVAPTPSRHPERFEAGVAPTPSASHRRADASAPVTPASPRRQRQPDAMAPAMPSTSRRQRQPDASSGSLLEAPDRSRGDAFYGGESTLPLPRPRRGSAALGKVQSPRAPAKHEADERVRRTLRITPKVDQHLHALAALLGLDLNGALSVAIVEHHLYLLHRRGPTDA